MGSKNIRSWTNDEINLLIKYYPKMGAQYCADLIGRSIRACQLKAKEIRVTKKASFKYENIEDFKNLINSCYTYKECVIKLELSPRCSGNYQTIKKYIKKYEIDISHFKNGFEMGNEPKSKIPIDDMLKKDSFVNRSSLKSRLFSEGLKIKKCEICQIGEDWFNGSKIVHILDHINGDPYDNRINNLRIVCPNCNSTLETNCRGNKVRKIYDFKKNRYVNEKDYKKCHCGSLITKKSKFCNDCKGISSRKSERPSLEILLSEVEKMGYSETGRKYGVSDNSIRKWIKLYEKKNN